MLKISSCQEISQFCIFITFSQIIVTFERIETSGLLNQKVFLKKLTLFTSLSTT